MTAADIYNLARAAGFPDSTAAVTMTAIALKESGGNPNAYNGVAPDDSYGLWQINMRDYPAGQRAHLMQVFGITAASQLFDPAVNARAAYVLWGGNDANLARDWYPNQTELAKVQANLPTAQAAADAAGAVVASTATGGGDSTATGVSPPDFFPSGQAGPAVPPRPGSTSTPLPQPGPASPPRRKSFWAWLPALWRLISSIRG